MKQIIKNPFTIWFVRLIKSKVLEYKNRDKFLKIGYMANVVNCSFGFYNTIYDEVSIDEVILGDFTYIAKNTKIFKTTIGKFCSIGSDCKIGLGKHPSKDFVSTHPVFFSTLKQAQISFVEKNFFDEFEPVNIGNDVWIGSNVIILDGVTIADGAIIGAGSVVTRDVKPYEIVGGVPAKTIRFRFDQDIIVKLLDTGWWNWDIDKLRENYNKFHNIEKLIDYID